jgi:hypothetical protein
LIHASGIQKKESTMTESGGSFDKSVLRALIDKEAIRDVLLRYSHGMDRRDSEVIASVFWPDSPLEYGMYTGTGPDFSTFIVSWFDSMQMSTTAHLLGNCLIRLNNDEAYAETYFQAFHRATNDEGVDRDVFVSGRYHDVLTRRTNEWRISKRQLHFDWFRNFSDTGDWAIGTYGVNSQTAFIGLPREAPWEEFRALLLSRNS